MNRLKVRDPSGLCWACGSSMPYRIQKRRLFEEYPRGVIVPRSPTDKPRRKTYSDFSLPDIVLDLDAEDSQYVRPFNANDAAQQAFEWGYEPVIPEVVQRVRELRRQLANDDEKMRRAASTRHSPLSISDHDVFSVALLGGGTAASSLQDDQARDEKDSQDDSFLKMRNKALQANGTPDRVLAGDANTIIHFMLHRQQLASASRKSFSTAAVDDVDDSNAFNRALDRSKEILWKTEAQSMEAQSKQQILKFINNFTMKQLSTNAGLNSSMSLLGLYLAAELGLLPAVIQYLQICLSQRFIGYTQVDDMTVRAAGNAIQKALERGEGSARGTRPELFTLLTGRALANSAMQPALFESSFIGSEEDPHTHHIYARLLGELGAFRLLWHSWRARPQEIRGEEDDTRLRQYEHIFESALIRCAEMLSSGRGAPGIVPTAATGDLEEDAELDLQAINALDAYHASSESASAPYSSLVEAQLSRDEIKEVLSSTDIHQAVARINHLISAGASLEPSEE